MSGPLVRLVTPSVYVVGRQIIDECALQTFLEDNDAGDWDTDAVVAADELIEVAGRTCYMSFAAPRPGGGAAYLRHMLASGHGSVMEHAVFNLIVDGVSRSFSHELVRHRAGWGYSQLSQRYVDENDCAFVVPPALEREVHAAREFLVTDVPLEDVRDDAPDVVAGVSWLESMDNARQNYQELSDYLFRRLSREAYGRANMHADTLPDLDVWMGKLDRDVRTALRKSAREAARSVLPNAAETKLFVTANVRALRHFIEMRAHPAADAEMRRVAMLVYRAMLDESPALFGDYVVREGGDGVTTPYPKV